MAEEREVEADVVADDDRVADELVERRQHRTDPGCLVDDGVGQSGQHRDLRRDRPARVDEGLERAEELTATDLDRADLGDLVIGPVPTGRLEIEDTERHVTQRRPEFIERTLHQLPCSGPNSHHPT